MHRLLLLALLLLLLWISALILVAAPVVGRALAREQVWLCDDLGIPAAERVTAYGHQLYHQGFVHPGLVAASYAALLPDTATRKRSGTLADLGSRDIFPYFAGRLDVLWDLIHQSCIRPSLLGFWLPWLAPVALATLLDAGLRRRVKLLQFGNASPTVHRYSLYGLLLLCYLAVPALLLPAPLPPFLAPLWLGLLIACLHGILANTPARV